MQRSEQPHIELAKAKKSLEEIKSASSIQEMEESWKAYLHRIERTWNRVLHHYGKSPNWNGWQATVLKQRKSDPLLSYLINARGCDEHTGEDIVSRKSGGITVGTSDGGPLYIKEFSISGDGFRFEGSSNASIEFSSAGIALKSIVNRGREYQPPTEHLGTPLASVTMIDIAQAGINFYDGFIGRVEAFFVK